jgi:hypothetical protein
MRIFVVGVAVSLAGGEFDVFPNQITSWKAQIE